MRVFLFEFVTGGGFLEIEGRPLPDGSLLHEGDAMWRALHEDFSALDEVEVWSMRDARLPTVPYDNVSRIEFHVREQFFNFAIACDYTLVIAPEFSGHLYNYSLGPMMAGVRLLSPNVEFIQVASDKTMTAERLTRAGVPIARGQRLLPGELIPQSITFPAVLKQNDGAGSMCRLLATDEEPTWTEVMRIEPFVQGHACSQSFLCRGTDSPIACPPMSQILSAERQFEYLGGERLMDARLVARATKLATRAIVAMPPTNGYVGVDLVLGDCPDGTEDCVIEINPRMTTSYIGLRQIASKNLAQAMIEITCEDEPRVEFSDEPVAFDADGTIR